MTYDTTVRASKDRELLGTLRTHRVVGGLLVAVLALTALAAIACGPPPIGWQGAGRLQTLPAPESVVSGTDAGTDSGSDADSEGGDAA